MNALGIDYGRIVSVIGLRENVGPAARLRSVGDGFRDQIPHAVAGSGRWGSQALGAPDAPPGPNSHTAEPWTDPPGAAVLWQGFYARLYSFLGRLEPIADNGYRLVVAVQSADHAEAATRVGTLAARAGFADTACIPAADALLCRWLAETALEQAADRTVVAVAVGDTTVQVRAYRARHLGQLYPEVLAAGRPVLIAGAGQAWWLGRVLELLAQNLSAPIPAELALAMRDAAAELGAQLGRAAPGQKVSWTGPLAGKLLSPVHLTRQTCATWPEVVGFSARLAQATAAALASLGAAPTPDHILIGGVGAAWPFAAAAAGELVDPPHLWQSPDPAHAVAFGAAWWPLIGEPSAATLEIRGQSDLLAGPAAHLDVPPAAPLAEPAAEPPAEPPAAAGERPAVPARGAAESTYGDILPPWERR